MASKKRKPKYERYLILPDGEQLKIIGEDGIYWYCEGTQFFKRLGYKVVERKIDTESQPEESAEK